MTFPVTVCGFDELAARTAYALWQLRQDVFVVEQECAYPDLDGRDVEPGTRHVLLHRSDELLGCLRVVRDADGWAQIGRVALRRDARGRGLADRLIHAALDDIAGAPSRLNAQVPLARWYASFGYQVSGAEFVEDGIAHLPMSRPSTTHRPGDRRPT